MMLRGRDSRFAEPSQPEPANAASTSQRRTDRLRLLLVLVAIGFGSFLRIQPAGHALLFGDEASSLRDIEKTHFELLTTFPLTGSGMALPLLQKLATSLFGAGHFSLRFAAWFGGLCLLVTTYVAGRRTVGANAAAAATFLVASSGILIFYSHFGRSYSLVAWLALTIVALLQWIVQGSNLSRGARAALVAAVAAVPYVHLTGLATVGPAAIGALASLWWIGRREAARALFLTLMCGFAVATLLYLLVAAEMPSFFGTLTGRATPGDFGALDVAALITGNRTAAVAAMGAVVAAVATVASQARAHALPLLLGALAPFAAIALLPRFADPYAYARYILVALAPLAWVIGWSLDIAAKRVFGGGARASSACLVAGAVLAASLFVVGPLGLARTDDGPHGNTYMALYPLPAFDAPWPGATTFYAQLAGKTDVRRIIEAPALFSRNRHLYRNAYLRHGVETWLGVFPDELPRAPDGPYVLLGEAGWRERADADYLIVHIDAAAETARYLGFVYAQSRPLPVAQRAYMNRHAEYALDPGPLPAALRRQLRKELGAPIFRDESVIVWRLR